eukprot:11183275-Karenia_brevis.AAC.1
MSRAEMSREMALLGLSGTSPPYLSLQAHFRPQRHLEQQVSLLRLNKAGAVRKVDKRCFGPG